MLYSLVGGRKTKAIETFSILKWKFEKFRFSSVGYYCLQNWALTVTFYTFGTSTWGSTHHICHFPLWQHRVLRGAVCYTDRLHFAHWILSVTKLVKIKFFSLPGTLWCYLLHFALLHLHCCWWTAWATILSTQNRFSTNLCRRQNGHAQNLSHRKSEGWTLILWVGS